MKKETGEIEIIEKYSRALRWMHWINFPLLALMIWSGVLIYWANPAYFEIPDFLSKFFNIPERLAEGMGWHFFLMWIFALNGFAYVIYLFISGEWHTLWPRRHDFRDSVLVALHDLHLRKAPPLQALKFNAAQRIAYTLVILMGGFALLTGLVIYKPVQMHYLTFLLGGYAAARLEHFILMIGFILFFIVHVVQVMKAGWNQFRAMVTGYEIKKN
jgi:thiosulfate reductase cytochrome b subunit